MKSLVGFILGILAFILQWIELFIVPVVLFFVVEWFGKIIGYENIYVSVGSFIKEGDAGGIGAVLFFTIFLYFWITKAKTIVAKFHNDIVDNIKSKIFKD